MTQHRLDQMNDLFRRHNKLMEYKSRLVEKRAVNNMGQAIKNELIGEGYVLAWDEDGIATIQAPPS
jgi:hypothetical protein